MKTVRVTFLNEAGEEEKLTYSSDSGKDCGYKVEGSVIRVWKGSLDGCETTIIPLSRVVWADEIIEPTDEIPF